MSGRPNWFIGFPVKADALPAGVLESLPAGLRRFHPDDLHVTLAFLGPVEAARAKKAWREAIALPARPFTVWSGVPAAFGSPRRPSAYGLDLNDPSGELIAFLKTHRDRLREIAGQAPERHSVRPHVTLGRPPRRGGDVIRARADAWVDTARPESRPIRLDRMALYTWSEDRRERLFRRLAERILDDG